MNINYEKVQTNFLKPLTDLFNKNLNEYQQQAYVEELEHFTIPELVGAVKLLRIAGRYFPSIAESVKAAYQFRDQAIGKISRPEYRTDHPWLLAEKQAVEMTKEYVAMFQRTATLWNQAVREKWDLALWKYVYAVASVQAQMISGARVGWNKADIFGLTAELTEETLKFWLDRQKEQANTGGIDVSIPSGTILEFQQAVPKVNE